MTGRRVEGRIAVEDEGVVEGEGVVEVRDVTHRAGGVTVLHEVSMSAEAGRLVVLAGRSGSGKSTLCHLVAGVSTPGSGSVRVAGRPASPPGPWSTVSLLPQRLALVPELTVRENVLWPALLAGRDAPSDLLADLGLDHLQDHPARSASLGEQQRTALARALAVGPAVAVLDEPTGHQDDANVERVLAALGAATAAGTCVLVATHDERVLEVADVVVRLEGGRVVG